MKRLRFALVCCIVLTASAPFVLARNGQGTAKSFANNPTQAQLDAVFADFKSSDAPGAAVLVLHHGRTVFAKGYGLADLSSATRVTPATDFRLASLTKQFTAMAVMLLVHDGKLRYDEPLTEALPGFPAYGKSITIRNLLNHTSGLLDYEELMAAQHGGTLPNDTPQIRDAGVVKLLEQQSTTKFAPGTKWDYSNSGYAVLAMVVERASGKKFEIFLRDRIFQPLGMRNTVAYVNGENQVPNRAYGHSRQPDGGWKQTDQSPTSAVLGDGGIYTSVNDFAKWINGIREHKLLSAQEFQPAITPVNTPATGPDGSPATYGFGWFLNSYKGHRRMWHYGETVGFLTNIQYFPDDDLAVLVLCNRTDQDPSRL
ncbi:MAG TPA: serine hydrolase domain-containing protein, partial [Terriglobales bacterium]|nr:serine hydrolase domain-containing protein [Terriglobales bacterium]